MNLKCFALIENEGKYLLIKEATPKWHGKWYLPGGKAKQDESLEAALKREVKEEAGCSITPNGIFYIEHRQRLFGNKLTLFFSASLNDGARLKDHADKHSLEAHWFSYSQILRISYRGDLPGIIEHYNRSCIPVGNVKLM